MEELQKKIKKKQKMGKFGSIEMDRPLIRYDSDNDSESICFDSNFGKRESEREYPKKNRKKKIKKEKKKRLIVWKYLLLMYGCLLSVPQQKKSKKRDL